MTRILIIEDDPDIALSLRYALEKDGTYKVASAEDGESGLREALRNPPQLILLDLSLPRLDGLDVCRQLRADRSTAGVPVIMLTARVDESDLVSGLELGADDYITKPFSVKEVLARIRAVLRRAARADHDETRVLRAGELVVDEARHRVTADQTEIALTRKEFDLLSDLMRHRGRVQSRRQLLERVWGYDHPGSTRTVDVHVRQLRKKLGANHAGKIETVVGVGYRFREDEA